MCFEVVGLIYNKKLVPSPPAQLSDLIDVDKRLKTAHPGVGTILWDYDSPYYSWGIFATAGAYVFAKTEEGYDTTQMGIATPGSIDTLNHIIALVHARVLPKATTPTDIPKHFTP